MLNELIIVYETKTFWDVCLPLLSAAGTLLSAIVALFLAFKKKHEKVIGSYILTPLNSKIPDSIEFTLKNRGKDNVPLPDVLRVDFFVGAEHWGTSYTKKRQNDFIPSGFNNYKNSVKLPKTIFRNIIDSNEPCCVFVWTKNGTRVELKKEVVVYGNPYRVKKISNKKRGEK